MSLTSNSWVISLALHCNFLKLKFKLLPAFAIRFDKLGLFKFIIYLQWYIEKHNTQQIDFAWTCLTPHRRRLISFLFLGTNSVNPLSSGPRIGKTAFEYLTLILQAALPGDDVFPADIKQLSFALVFCKLFKTQLFAGKTNFAVTGWPIKQCTKKCVFMTLKQSSAQDSQHRDVSVSEMKMTRTILLICWLMQTVVLSTVSVAKGSSIFIFEL